MSAYRTVETTFTDVRCLKRALEENGKHPVLHSAPVRLKDYQGKERTDTAELVIPRKDVQAAANDIGFKKQADGTIKAIISEYDSHNYGPAWLKKIKKTYTELKLKKEAYNLDLEYLGRQVLPNGKVRLQYAPRG